jgi:hypothetical protein
MRSFSPSRAYATPTVQNGSRERAEPALVMMGKSHRFVIMTYTRFSSLGNLTLLFEWRKLLLVFDTTIALEFVLLLLRGKIPFLRTLVRASSRPRSVSLALALVFSLQPDPSNPTPTISIRRQSTDWLHCRSMTWSMHAEFSSLRLMDFTTFTDTSTR